MGTVFYTIIMASYYISLNHPAKFLPLPNAGSNLDEQLLPAKETAAAAVY